MDAALRLAVSAVAICAVATAAARGDEGGGWKMPNLNPFSRSGGPPTSARINDDDGWKLPKLWPASGSNKSTAKTKSPSAWQKMTTGTKTFMAKTADAINPFDDAQDSEPVHVTGSRNAFRQAAAKKKEQSGSWLPSLWSAKEEDEPAKTVNDFLSRPRPQP